MNKLIIISLVIFFAICSKSWAEHIISEKYLKCDLTQTMDIKLKSQDIRKNKKILYKSML